MINDMPYKLVPGDMVTIARPSCVWDSVSGKYVAGPDELTTVRVVKPLHKRPAGVRRAVIQTWSGRRCPESVPIEDTRLATPDEVRLFETRRRTGKYDV